MLFKIMKILFLSNQLFDYPLKTNKWHVATRVADRGHKVLFVDPPIRFRKVVKQIFQGRWSLQRLINGFYPSGNSAKEKPFGFIFPNPKGWGIGRAGKNRLEVSPALNLKVFTPLTTTPSESSNLTSFNVNRMKKQLPAFFEGDAILWVYNPSMVEYINQIPHKLLVYDCVDDYPSMANYKRLGLSEKIAEQEAKIAEKADVVFATTKNLAKKLQQWNENVFYVGNAGDYARFAEIPNLKLQISKKREEKEKTADKLQITNGDNLGGTGEEHLPQEKPPGLDLQKPRRLGNAAAGEFGRVVSSQLRDIPHPRIGFTGAIDDYKVNLPLLVEVAKKHSNKSLVLVGPTGVADTQPDLRELKKLDNVYFVGKRPYQEMPSFHAGFDVFIIPYNLNDYTVKGCFPVKFLNALAAGLPVVVTNLPAYEDFREISYIAKDEGEFSNLIQKALNEDSPEKREARMRTARENSWENKVEKMLHIVSSAL